MKRLKILHIIASVNPSGGGPIEGIIRQNQACENLTGTREFVSLDAPDEIFLKNFPMPVHALGEKPSHQRSGFLARFGYTPNYVPWLKQNIQRYDAVIVNGLWNFSSAGASMVLPQAKTPYFVFTHGMMDPWFKSAYPIKHIAKQGFWLAADGRLMAGARSAFFTCEEEMLLARGQFWGHKYRETVVGYGASPPPAQTPEQFATFYSALPSLRGKRFLLFLSRIHPKKACDVLVEGFAAVAKASPDLDLVIAGPDQTEWRPQLEALSSQLGVSDRIHWPGPLYGDAKWGAMRAAEAFILPSHQENFGIAVAEALACGTPVLISDKVNIWREIEAAGAGFVESDTLEGCEKLIKDWLSLDKARASAMRLAAVELFNSKFNMQMAGPKLLKTIERLL